MYQTIRRPIRKTVSFTPQLSRPTILRATPTQLIVDVHHPIIAELEVQDYSTPQDTFASDQDGDFGGAGADSNW